MVSKVQLQLGKYVQNIFPTGAWKRSFLFYVLCLCEAIIPCCLTCLIWRCVLLVRPKYCNLYLSWAHIPYFNNSDCLTVACKTLEWACKNILHLFIEHLLCHVLNRCLSIYRVSSANKLRTGQTPDNKSTRSQKYNALKKIRFQRVCFRIKGLTW